MQCNWLKEVIRTITQIEIAFSGPIALNAVLFCSHHGYCFGDEADSHRVETDQIAKLVWERKDVFLESEGVSDQHSRSRTAGESRNGQDLTGNRIMKRRQSLGVHQPDVQICL